MIARFRALYGSGPLHLAAVVVCLVLVVVAGLRILDSPSALKIAIWFVGAALAHDLLFVPLYTLLDRLAGGRRPRVAVNFVRVPAVLSGVLLLISLGLVFQLQPGAYAGATGLEPTPYLERWLVITGVIFLASALAYVVRARRLAGS